MNKKTIKSDIKLLQVGLIETYKGIPIFDYKKVEGTELNGAYYSAHKINGSNITIEHAKKLIREEKKFYKNHSKLVYVGKPLFVLLNIYSCGIFQDAEKLFT